MGRQWIIYCVHSARHFLGLSNEGAAMVRIVNRAHSVVDLDGSRIHDWYGALWRLALNFGHSPASDPANSRVGLSEKCFSQKFHLYDYRVNQDLRRNSFFLSIPRHVIPWPRHAGAGPYFTLRETRVLGCLSPERCSHGDRLSKDPIHLGFRRLIVARVICALTVSSVTWTGLGRPNAECEPLEVGVRATGSVCVCSALALFSKRVDG